MYLYYTYFVKPVNYYITIKIYPGEKLRTVRTSKGFTQKQIANAICTTDSNYCRKENGDVKIFNDEWKKIAILLAIPIEDIYEDDEKMIINNQNQSAGKFSGPYSIYHNMEELLISNLQDYIALLKKENERLKYELSKYTK